MLRQAMMTVAPCRGCGRVTNKEIAQRRGMCEAQISPRSLRYDFLLMMCFVLWQQCTLLLLLTSDHATCIAVRLAIVGSLTGCVQQNACLAACQQHVPPYAAA
jgi:hypothetical protein